MQGFSMRTGLRALVLGGAATVLVALPGCMSGPPTEYYKLDMRRSADAKMAPNISVGLFSITEPLSQKNVLIQKSPTQIEYYATGHWAGSVDEMLKEKLETEFGPSDSKARMLVLSGDVLAFEQVDVEGGAEAHVKLEAELREAGKSRYAPPLLRKIYDIAAPTRGTGANAAAQALSRCVEQLARQIADDAAGL